MRSTKRTSSRRVVFQPRTWQGMHRGAIQIVRGDAHPRANPRIVAFSPEMLAGTPDLYDNGGDIARRIHQIRDRDADVGAMLIRDLLWRLQNRISVEIRRLSGSLTLFRGLAAGAYPRGRSSIGA